MNLGDLDKCLLRVLREMEVIVVHRQLGDLEVEIEPADRCWRAQLPLELLKDSIEI